MPTTAVGKISKPALRQDAVLRAAASAAGQIVGSRGTFSVSIDESGLRPKVVLKVTSSATDRGETLEALQSAFEKFEFLSEIELQ